MPRSEPGSRTLRAATLAALLVASLAIPGLALADVEPWGQYQGGASHPGSAEAAPSPPYRQAWTFREPDSDRGLSGPVVVDDLALAVGVGGVFAVDLATGAERWSVPRDGGPLAVPAVGETGGGKQVVVFTEGGGEGSRIVAIDMGSQEERWSASLGATSQTGVTIDGDAVFVGDHRGTLHGFALGSGDPLWEPVESGGRILTPPTAADGRVFAITIDTAARTLSLFAVDASTGEVDWRFEPPAGGVAVSPTSVIDRRVFGVSLAQELLAFDAATGDEEAFGRVGSLLFALGSASAIGDDVLAADGAGGIYRLDGATGDLRWSFQINEGLSGPPAVAGTTVLAGLGDGRLVAIDGDSARLLWESEPAPGALGPIAVTPEVVVVSKGGRSGGLVGWANDPDGALLDEPSPTEVDPVRLVGSFAIAAVAVTLVLFGIARGLLLVVEPPGGRLWTEDEDEAGDDEGPGEDA